MPRSFQFRNRLRLGLLALVLLVPFFIVGYHASAQKRNPAQTKKTQTLPGAQDPQKKNLTRLNSSETAEGSSITIFSDLPLNDYAAYRGGDRFYVLIPGADASRLLTSLRGRGFTDVRAVKRGNDVLLSFRLLAGAAARVSQKFNRLEILITVPALAAENTSTNANNTNSRSQTDPAQSTGNTNTGSANTRARSGSRRGNRGSGNYYSSESSTTGSSSTTGQTQAETNSNIKKLPDGIPVGPEERVEQPGVSDYTPTPQTSPIVSPSTNAPGDQVAQLQPAPVGPGTSTDAAPTTTTPGSSTGSTFGAQLKQNWLFVLLAVAIAGLIAWVIFARSRGDQSPVERRVETIRESRNEAKAVPAPIKVKAVPAPVKAKPVPTPEKVEKPPAKIETPPADVEAKSTSVKDLVAPAVVAAVFADAASEDSIQEVVEVKEIVPEKPVAAEQASADVASLLSGGNYDEASIATEHPEARQMVAAELLAALSGRNIVRHERAREAFIKHGYFDDATRTLRTADSPGERASAARSLGLVRDTSGTPHLVAALDDSSPEVRRAAVESLAEVRDPSAVAPLEALRDREKNRKVPKALIQHAIEASVVGRTKQEPPAVAVPSYETSPLTADAEPGLAAEESSFETAPLSLEDYTAQAPEVTESLPSVESDYHVIEVGSETSQVVAPPEIEEAGVINAETDTLPYGEVIFEEPEKLEAPAATEEFTLDLDESTPDEWVDIDVGRPSNLGQATPKVIAPVESVEDVLLEDASSGAVIAEAPVEVVEPTAEATPAATEPPLLPFVATEAVVASEASTVEERGLDVAGASDKEIEIVGGDHTGVSPEILRRLTSEDESERAAAVEELGKIGGEDSFREVCGSFDDRSPDVRNAAARALYNLNPDRAASFTRALREASPDRRRNIGGALSSSGLAAEAIGNLMGESREKTYDAFSLLFLMAKAGEVQPLMRAVEEHPNNEVRLAVVKLLALSGQQDILPAFRRLAVRGSLPTEVRSAVMEAIYQISSQSSETSS